MSYPKYSASGMIVAGDWDAITRNVLNRGGGATAVVGFNTNLSGRENYWFCDGVADDVQMNLATAYVAALGGGSVELERGAFNNVATVSVPLDVSLFGQGFDTQINYDAGGNCITITGDNVKLRDFKVVIVAGAGGAGTRPSGIYGTGRTNVEITNLWLVGDTTEADDGSMLRQSGILFSLSNSYCKIIGCTVQDFERNGINLYATIGNENEHMAAEGNICYDNLDDGIHLEFTTYSMIVGNVCQSNNANGIFLYNSSTDNVVTGNMCQDNTTGIRLALTSDNNTVTGNTCQGNQEGIFIIGSSNNAISGNTCQGGTTDPGINLFSANNNTIVGNICFQNVTHGILLDTCSGNTVVGNTCNENDVNNTASFDGICIENDSDYNIVHSNTCNDNDRWGISIGIVADDCVGNWVKDNHLRGNTSGAFSDQGTDTKLATVHCQLTQAVNGAALKDSAWASPNGVDVDAATEGAVGTVWLPPEVQQVVRIIIYGWSNVIEAANNMLLNVYIVGGSSSEQWNAESIDVADVPSEETGGIAANDVLHWVIDATDDANVGDLVGGDLLHCAAVGEGASAPDIATDAVFGDCIIEYV